MSWFFVGGGMLNFDESYDDVRGSSVLDLEFNEVLHIVTFVI